MAVIEKEVQNDQVSQVVFEFRSMDVRLTAIETRLDTDTVLPHLATKADLIKVASKIEKLESNRYSKLAGLEARVARSESTIIRWFAGAVVAIITANVATAAIVLSILK